MDYFEGIVFLHHAEMRAYQHVVDGHQDYWGIQYNHAGPLEVQTDDGPRQELEGSWVFCTFSGPRFRYGSPAGRGRHHVYIAFTGPRTIRMQEAGLLPRDPHPRRVDRPAAFLQEMRVVQQAVMRRDEAEAVHRLEGLLLTLHTLGQPRQDMPAGVAELAARVAEEPQRDWDLTVEARRLGLSPDHLRRIFRHHCGQGFWQHVLARRLERAAEAVCTGDDPLATVAKTWGFHDAQHLTRFFRRRYAMAPGAYRRAFGRRDPRLFVPSRPQPPAEGLP